MHAKAGDGGDVDVGMAPRGPGGMRRKLGATLGCRGFGRKIVQIYWFRSESLVQVLVCLGVVL